MLDPWIIDEILRRHKEKRHSQRPYVELPALPPPEDSEAEEKRREKERRGVVVVDYTI